MLTDLKRIKIADLNEQIDTLKSQGDYIENYEKINELKSKLEKFSKAKNIEDLELDFKEAIQILLKNDIPILLKEEDKTVIRHDKTEYTSLKDFVLVHKTSFCPKDSIIRTSRNSGAKLPGAFLLGDDCYQYEYLNERNTVHFTVNGEVESHTYGNFDNRKYAVIVPFSNVPKKNIGGSISVDTYVIGDVELDENCWIMCPAEEIEEVRRLNPKAQVIGYEGKSVDDYANAFISILGYKKEIIGSHVWQDEKSQAAFNAIIKNEGIKWVQHAYSDEGLLEKKLVAFNEIVEIAKIVREKGLDMSQYSEYQKFWHIIKEGRVGDFSPKKAMDLTFFKKKLEENGFHLDEKLEKAYNSLLQHYDEEEVKTIKLDDLDDETQKKLDEYLNGIDSPKMSDVKGFIFERILKNLFGVRDKDIDKKENTDIDKKSSKITLDDLSEAIDDMGVSKSESRRQYDSLADDLNIVTIDGEEWIF